MNRTRLYAALLVLGAGILLYRTIALLTSGAWPVLMPWVIALDLVEMAIDVTVIVAAIRWGVSTRARHASLALRAGAAAAILHAVRVLVFVMGRVGPWKDFDVRPAERALHAARWTWGEVWFAGILSVLGVVGVIVIWWFRHRAFRRTHAGLRP